ncbi:hypothetical protein HPB50_001924 [Hyalomma asiaticum]|uniref:Uncharacterized protein n=1 Tax=Hyalomma asiaticum TaxID=266040 RepID=A0ACB7TAY4_HYAAI|nr:hypothetical protein HPB50_001924 [Hyalomma asiaticum]
MMKRVEKSCFLQRTKLPIPQHRWKAKRIGTSVATQENAQAYVNHLRTNTSMTLTRHWEMTAAAVQLQVTFALQSMLCKVTLSPLSNAQTWWNLDADAQHLAATLRLPSGVGATCVLLWPLNGSSSILVPSSNANYSERSLDWDMLDAFEPECRSVFVPGLPLDNFVPPLPTVESPTGDSVDVTTSPGNVFHPVNISKPVKEGKERFYPYCHCSADKTGYVCEPYGFQDPPMFRALTGDILLDISSQNEHEYYLYTTDMYRLRRYGAFSFGLSRDYVPSTFGEDAPALFRKIAVRDVAKVWYNNKGYHAMPTYVNSINNAILRANLPPENGHPSTYGITVVNHPMTDTSFLLSKDQM